MSTGDDDDDGDDDDNDDDGTTPPSVISTTRTAIGLLFEVNISHFVLVYHINHAERTDRIWIKGAHTYAQTAKTKQNKAKKKVLQCKLKDRKTQAKTTAAEEKKTHRQNEMECDKKMDVCARIEADDNNDDNDAANNNTQTYPIRTRKIIQF